MKRLLLSATMIAANAIALPGYCQAQGSSGQSYTSPQAQLNQQLNTKQEPLQVIQQHQGVSNSTLKGLLDEMKGLVKDMVKVDTTTGDPKVHVKAPFVNVDVDHGQPNVNVHAPFVNVTKSDGSPVSVEAPFTKVGAPHSSAGNLNQQSPAQKYDSFPNTSGNFSKSSVGVDAHAGGGANVHAPFVNINSNQNGTQVQAPFTNIGGSQVQTPANSDPNSGASNSLP